MSQALADAVAGGGSEAALAVCRACVEWLPMTGASITMMTVAEVQEPVCATDAVSARIDELQFGLGDGPCVESFRTGRAVLVPDIADPTETRWPVFAAAAAATGARGMFVFPLQVGGARIGVLDCYRDAPGPLDDEDLTGALRTADAAVWSLLDRSDPGGAVSAGAPDGSALVRAEVHQATGMLMAQARLDAPSALARLRAYSFSTGRTITEVADDVVARRLRLHPDGVWSNDASGHTDHRDARSDDPVDPPSRDDEEKPS
ncbi:GAF and ANTAR domain-containing protein [Actinomycetospora sp. NBC_00405]|uniref:GAF and ANTAR domain-containing protein n=1 Tax=Actinomycetospora sp. NBC_00405 TaxID=2975952 RepID=UPI002E203639